MRQPQGLFVAIFGADGSGKSSVIETLLHTGSLTKGGVRYMHFRPRIGTHLRDGQPVTEPHGQPPRGWYASVAKLLYYFLDYQLGYLLKIRPELTQGSLVIFDRYYHDLLVDTRRYRYGGPAFLSHLVGKLIPTPDLSILLDADPELLWARKQEVSIEELHRARDAYVHLMAALPNSRVVDASRPLQEVVATVEEIIHSHRSIQWPVRSRLHSRHSRFGGSRLSPMNGRHKSFPPGLGHIRIPMSSRQAALAALAMYTACKPRTLRLQKIAWACTKWFGPWILPGNTQQWVPPMSTGVWEEILERWKYEFGPFDSLAVCGRLQSARSGSMFLLLRQGAPVVFVKLRQGGDAVLAHELRVLETIFKFKPTSFFVPEPCAFGKVGEWAFLGTMALPPELHRVPENPPLDVMLSEIGHALAEIPRPITTPSHWRPMHGDFTPWNLRQFDRHGLVLYDWEDAGWGPPGADDVLYRATAAALRGDAVQVHEAQEAVDFWQDRLGKRSTADRRDDRLTKSLCDILAQMAALPPAAHP